MTAPTSPPESEVIKASIFQRLHPQVYLERFIFQNVRPDDRPLALGEIFLSMSSISTADGSALVRLGDTTIVCGIKAEIAEPELDRPKEGFLSPILIFLLSVPQKFKPGPPTEEAQVLSDRLNDALTASGIILPSSLMIHPGNTTGTLQGRYSHQL